MPCKQTAAGGKATVADGRSDRSVNRWHGGSVMPCSRPVVLTSFSNTQAG